MKALKFGSWLIALALSASVAQAADSAPVAPAAAPAALPLTDDPLVVISTTMGDITVELLPDRAPVTVDNFLAYVNDHFYDGTIFHRVIDNFMVQGGGLTPDLKEKPARPAIKNESTNGLKNLRGTLAMARRPEPNSATSQFFINVADNASLDYPALGGYTVFGKVVAGMDVVDKIKSVPTGNALKDTMKNVPLTAVVMTSVHLARPYTPKPRPADSGPTYIIKTSLGEITVQLDKEKAPLSVANFDRYVKEKSYDGTVFHRVIPGFMIQGGGFTPSMVEKPAHDPIKNEAPNGLRNERGTLAMARTAVLDSATSQFFINVVDNRFLDYPNNGGYAVFGKVIDGMDVVDKIKAVRTHEAGGMSDVPAEPVVITSIRAKE